MSERVPYIDVAKGLSIVMVAFSHSPLRFEFSEADEVMRLFRLPLFFFLSGVFLRVNEDWKRYLIRKADTVLKPYLVTQSLILVALICLGEAIALKDVGGVLYGAGPTIRNVPMWYLPHLWALFLVASLLARFTPIERSGAAVKSLLIVALFASGPIALEMFWHKTAVLGGFEVVLPGLPFSLDVLPVSLGFFLAGHFLSADAKSFRPRIWLFVLSFGVTWYVASHTAAHINLNVRLFTVPFLAALSAFVGIYMLFSLAYWFAKVPLLRRVILPFSVATMFILIFHVPISSLTLRALGHMRIVDRSGAALALAFALGVVIPIFMRKVVTHSGLLRSLYLPRPSLRSG